MDLSLEEAHAIAEEVERAIEVAVPDVSSVRTHLEPLAEEAAGTEVAGDAATVRRIVRAELGVDPAELRFVDTDEGLVAYLTLRLGSRHPVGRARRREPDRGAHPARAA